MIAVFTITCNRLEITKKYLSELKDKNNTTFKHIIVDNGSTDGTPEWLISQGYTVIKLSKNIGVYKAMKIAIQYIKDNFKVDYIIKFDDDCELTKFGILDDIMKWYEEGCKSYITAPLDMDILETHMPKHYHKGIERNQQCRYTHHVGGIFVVAPIHAMTTMIKAKDDQVCEDSKRGRYWVSIGYPSIYFEDLQIRHRGLFKSVDNYKLLNDIIERP